MTNWVGYDPEIGVGGLVKAGEPALRGPPIQLRRPRTGPWQSRKVGARTGSRHVNIAERPAKAEAELIIGR
jgi:hypothetical protein